MKSLKNLSIIPINQHISVLFDAIGRELFIIVLSAPFVKYLFSNLSHNIKNRRNREHCKCQQYYGELFICLFVTHSVLPLYTLYMNIKI